METHIVLLAPGCVNVRVWATNEKQASEVATRAAEDLGLAWDGGFWVDLARIDVIEPPVTRYQVLEQ